MVRIAVATNVVTAFFLCYDTSVFQTFLISIQDISSIIQCLKNRFKRDDAYDCA